jgi:hypothetical protein
MSGIATVIPNVVVEDISSDMKLIDATRFVAQETSALFKSIEDANEQASVPQETQETQTDEVFEDALETQSFLVAQTVKVVVQNDNGTPKTYEINIAP